MNVLEVTRSIDAPASAAWQVIADMEGYANLTTDGIVKVEVLEGQHEGMLRQCTSNREQSWTETCTVWEEGRRFKFEVHTDAEDYPFPIKKLEGEWWVEPNGRGSVIGARFSYQLKNPVMDVLFRLIPAMRRRAKQDSEYMLNQWAEKAQLMRTG